MSNVYGVAHFAKQNAVPQVEWKNIDIIGQYIDNLNKQKQLEMMDKSYELAKDQAALQRDQFNYNKENDAIKQAFEEYKHGNASADALLNARSAKEVAGINNSIAASTLALQRELMNADALASIYANPSIVKTLEGEGIPMKNLSPVRQAAVINKILNQKVNDSITPQTSFGNGGEVPSGTGYINFNFD